MQAGRASFALKSWNDEPVNIHKRQHNQPPGHDGKRAQAPLYSALEQQKKGHREVHHDQKYGQSSPSAKCARHVPRDFIFQVAGPDDQELRKRHISPEHHECQHQVAKIVELRGRDDILHGLGSRKQAQDENHKGHGYQRFDDHEKEAIDSRKPKRFDGHYPIDRGIGDRDSPQNQARRAECFQNGGEACVARSILLGRPFVQAIDDGEPDGEINHRPKDEEIPGEVQHFEMQVRIRGLVSRPLRPWV